MNVAAYFVPHPLEKRMQLRIETIDGSDPTEALRRALDRLTETCDEFLKKFDKKLENFDA